VGPRAILESFKHIVYRTMGKINSWFYPAAWNNTEELQKLSTEPLEDLLQMLRETAQEASIRIIMEQLENEVLFLGILNGEQAITLLPNFLIYMGFKCTIDSHRGWYEGYS